METIGHRLIIQATSKADTGAPLRLLRSIAALATPPTLSQTVVTLATRLLTLGGSMARSKAQNLIKMVSLCC